MGFDIKNLDQVVLLRERLTNLATLREHIRHARVGWTVTAVSMTIEVEEMDKSPFVLSTNDPDSPVTSGALLDLYVDAIDTEQERVKQQLKALDVELTTARPDIPAAPAVAPVKDPAEAQADAA